MSGRTSRSSKVVQTHFESRTKNEQGQLEGKSDRANFPDIQARRQIVLGETWKKLPIHNAGKEKCDPPCAGENPENARRAHSQGGSAVWALTLT
jgi:hypothetical protein